MEPYLSTMVHLISDYWDLLLIAQGLRETLDPWGLEEERQVGLTANITL